MNADDTLEDQADPWSRGRDVARGVLRSTPEPEKGLFFAIGEGSIIFVVCFLHSSAQMCLCQMPGRRPPRITGRFVTTVTRGWVGAPNERPVQISWRSPWFCRSISVEDSESRRFELTFG